MDCSCRTAILVSAFLLLVSSGTVFSQSSSQRPTTALECLTEPPITDNANYTMPTSRTAGTIVTYTCKTGYNPVGSRQRVCRNGNWESSSPLRCNAAYCSRPPRIPYASYSYGYYTYRVGTTYTYNCYGGYKSNTSTTIACLRDRTWTQPLPRCVKKDCGKPAGISGGNVSYTLTVYSSYASYTCQPGYDLYYNGYRQYRGRYSVRCLSTGRWAIVPICKPKDCGLPSNIPNGVRYTQGRHVYGQSVTYECNHGYILQGNGSITCQANGRWSAFPQCKRVECDPPPKVADASTPLVAKAKYGNSTIYKCHKGFEIFGPAVVSCQSDGTWTQRPVCSKVDCRVPPAIHFGIHNWTSTTYKSSAQYKCDKGYKLIGVSKIYCNANGVWSDSPKCELPPGQTFLPSKAARTGKRRSSDKSDKSALTGLAIACSIFGVATIICFVGVIYTLFFAKRPLGAPFKQDM